MKTNKQSRTGRGFTMAELLVSMGVLSIVLILTLEVTDVAQGSVRGSREWMTAEGRARRVLNQLERDLRETLRRPDVPVQFEQEVGDDWCRLVVEREGYAGPGGAADRGVSLVSYRLRNFTMERASLGMRFGDEAERGSWEDGLVNFDGAETLPVQPEAQYQELAAGVLRFELAFLVDSGSGLEIRAEAPADLEALKGVIATVAVIGNSALRGAEEQDLALIADRLSDAGRGGPPGVAWRRTVEELPVRVPELRGDIVRSVRVYQRSFEW